MSKPGALFQSLLERFGDRSRSAVVVTAVLATVVVGIIDYWVGHEITISVFYLLGVAFATWFAGRALGIGLSVLSVAVGLFGDFASGERFSSPLVFVWNGLVLLSFYLVVVWLLTHLRLLTRGLEVQVRERTVALTAEIAERERLEREILEISEREQRRIGQDLHDGVCQHLTVATLAGQVLEEKLIARNLPEAADASRVVDLVEGGIDLCRGLAKGLHPVEVDADGLMTALEEYAATTTELYQIDCRFECDSPVLIHDAATALNLYRIVQEAVGNAIKHGKSRCIRIRLDATEEGTVVAVKDDGIGLPEPLPKTRGIGLRIMEHRASMICGSFRARADETGGTLVTCEMGLGPRPSSTPHG